jgi:hypothetical protein
LCAVLVARRKKREASKNARSTCAITTVVGAMAKARSDQMPSPESATMKHGVCVTRVNESLEPMKNAGTKYRDVNRFVYVRLFQQIAKLAASVSMSYRF